jgi:rare lipoprotein A
MRNGEFAFMSLAGRADPESGSKNRGAIGAGALCSLALLGASLTGCAQQPVRTTSIHHGHEYFSQAKYGSASPRVVADGEPVPHGGGQYLVGHPYTIAGHTYYPRENPNYSAIGLASWYGDAFHGRKTANGEVYDMRSLSAAHPTMPLPSYARVTNLGNGYSVIVRVNDRGPYHGGRVMDVSSRVADVLEIKGAGTARVKVDYIGPAPMEGSDDNELLASLRTDGSLATLNGAGSGSGAPSIFPVMVAQQQPAALPPPPVHLIAPSAPPPTQEPEPAVAAAVEPSRVFLDHPPVPPARPFDLGANSHASFAVASTNAPLPPKPPVRLSSGDRALYFATPPNPWLASRSDPFARLLIRADAHSVAGDDR